VGRRAIHARLFIIVAALVVLYGVAHLAMGKVSTGPLRTLIEKNLTQALGLEVTLDELVAALLPTPHLHAEGVRIANFPGRPSAQLLSIDHLDLGIALWPLLERSVAVDELTTRSCSRRSARGSHHGNVVYYRRHIRVGCAERCMLPRRFQGDAPVSRADGTDHAWRRASRSREASGAQLRSGRWRARWDCPNGPARRGTAHGPSGRHAAIAKRNMNVALRRTGLRRIRGLHFGQVTDWAGVAVPARLRAPRPGAKP
jgi:hypothetical protein